MAVGETSGQAARAPRPVVSSSGRRPAAEEGGVVTPVSDDEIAAEAATPLVKEADPELERLLAEEEEIERSTRDHNETPHFRSGDD